MPKWIEFFVWELPQKTVLCIRWGPIWQWKGW